MNGWLIFTTKLIKTAIPIKAEILIKDIVTISTYVIVINDFGSFDTLLSYAGHVLIK